MSDQSKNEQDEYRNGIIDKLINLESDPLDRKLLSISIPLSYVVSYIIKGLILLASWVFTIYWIDQIFKYFNLTHWLYFFISFCLGGLSSVILKFVWEKYVLYDRKKRGSNMETIPRNDGADT